MTRGDVQVLCGRGQRSVPHQPLDRRQRHTRFHQMSREAVAQTVDSVAAPDPNAPCFFLICLRRSIKLEEKFGITDIVVTWNN